MDSEDIDISLEDLRPAMVWLDKKKSWTFQQIAELFNTTRQTVSRAVNRFEEKGDFKDKARSGRPATATGKNHQKQLEEEIEKDGHTRVNSTRKLARKLKVSRRSVGCMLKRGGYRPWKDQERQHLTEKTIQKRLHRCKGLLERCKDDGYQNILFSDEKLFTIQQAFNRQNDRIWSKRAPPKEKRVHQREMKPKSVMVWGAVGHNIKSPLVFVPQGLKINQIIYRNMLRKEVRPWMKKEKLVFTLQQDGASSHTANETQAWCERNFDDYIKKNEWPPSSPDLTPLDYSIWGMLEQKACATPHADLNSLIEALQREWDALEQEAINKAVAQFPKRLQACVDAKGGHFE